MPHGMDVGLSPGDFVSDGDPVPSTKRGPSPQIFGPCLLFFCHTHVKRLYACAQIHYLCFGNYRIQVKYSGESRDITTV